MNASLAQRISEFARLLEDLKRQMSLNNPDPVAEGILAIVREQRQVPLAELTPLSGATKSVVWQKVNELERRGDVWLRKTHAEHTGHPRIIVYAADAVVTEERRLPGPPSLPRVSGPTSESGRVAAGVARTDERGVAEPSQAPAVAKAGA